MPIPKPATGEYSPFYQAYLDRVLNEPRLLPVLARQVTDFDALAMLDESRAKHRYADGKWSVREVAGHIADAECIFAYRMLRIARGDETPLAGFDENAYVTSAGFERRTMPEVAGELRDVRQATLSLVRSLTEETAARWGEANGVRVTARARVDRRRPCRTPPGRAPGALRDLTGHGQTRRTRRDEGRTKQSSRTGSGSAP